MWIEVSAAQCEYADCGHVWLPLDVPELEIEDRNEACVAWLRRVNAGSFLLQDDDGKSIDNPVLTPHMQKHVYGKILESATPKKCSKCKRRGWDKTERAKLIQFNPACEYRVLGEPTGEIGTVNGMLYASIDFPESALVAMKQSAIESRAQIERDIKFEMDHPLRKLPMDANGKTVRMFRFDQKVD